MVNHLGKFSRILADLSQPLRKLLSSRNSWIWEEAQEQVFNQMKEELLTPTIWPYMTLVQRPKSLLMPHL